MDKHIIRSCVRNVLRLLPVQKNKIVFLNFDGKGFGENPKYIAEEILRQKLPCKLVWLVKGDAFVPDTIKKVKNGFNAFYELATAKVIVSNCKTNVVTRLCKKKSQFYLQTWHGDFALKYIEKEVEGMLSSDYVSASKADGAITDAAVSGSESFSQILKESFWLSENCKILEFGVPRNDLYFRGADYKDELKNRFGFSPSDKILLYAPTLRDDGSTDCFNLDFEKLRVKLCQISNEKWKIVVRLHPYLSSKAGLFKYDDNIINGSLFDDQQELFMISDVLITDYSSIMGDFFLMEKPVFLYAPDLERYSNRSTGRGLRFQLPIPFNHCQDELEAQMAEFDEEEYAKEIKAFMQTCYKPFDDGHASERIVSVFKEVMRI